MLKLISIHIPRAIFRSIKSTYTTMFRNLDSSSVQNEKSGSKTASTATILSSTRSAKKGTRNFGGIVSGKPKIPYDRGQQLVRRR